MASLTDVVVIGGGPGGYVAALRAAQLGAQVILVEQERVGGVCLNHGCIPTKALLRSVEVLELTRRAGEFGVLVGEPRLDWSAVQARKNTLVEQMVGGVERLLERNGVDVVQATASLHSPGQVALKQEGETRQIEGRSVVIATGSRPWSPPIPGLNSAGVLTSRDALALETLPESLMIVGGGAVGVEFATLFAACGVQVTLVEMLPHLAPGLDGDIGAALEWSLTQRGVRVLTSTEVVAVEAGGVGFQVQVSGPAGEESLELEQVLMAAGRAPNVEGLGLDVVGVRHNRQGIAVDQAMHTNVPGVYAIGDVTGGAMLAHVAMHEGVVAAENALGRTSRMDYKAVPSCIFSWPEAASVGLGEEEAREQGYEVRVGKFPFADNGKSLVQGEAEGFVKVVANARFDEILGLHVVGPHASDLILEGTLALVLEATLDEIEAAIHPHPTLGEAVAEAALAARGRALHSLP